MIVSRVRRTLVERKLVERGMRILAACSGGPDSTAMLFALARLAPDLGFTLCSASVNHGLREAAAAEVEIARKQAAMAFVDFYPLVLNLKKGAGIQLNARNGRYVALKNLATEIGADRIAVGHTQDDQAESVLMRLLRGAGIGGLAGTHPMRIDGVIRPLIDCRRNLVHRYAFSKCSEIVFDPSNADTRYERVRVRQNVLPLLERENPAIVRQLADLADDARDQQKTLYNHAQRLIIEACCDVSAQGSNKSAADSPVTPNAPEGPARMVLDVPDEPDRGRRGDSNRIAPGSVPVLRDESATVATEQQSPTERLHYDSNTLSKSVFRAAERATRRSALRLWIRGRTGIEPGRSHIEQVDRALKKKGEVWLPKGWVILVSRETITCLRRTSRLKKNGK
ncbi:MAG: tRNA lysidine(34) synthetase TilS [Deltaproteobacteria bacterium]|nr:tRNA lysidine(34) synthetase TilS [Deltaproteobacteria bacterium]